MPRIYTYRRPHPDCRSACQVEKAPGASNRHKSGTLLYCKGHLRRGTPSHTDWAAKCCGNGQLSHYGKMYLASKLWLNLSLWGTEFYLQKSKRKLSVFPNKFSYLWIAGIHCKMRNWETVSLETFAERRVVARLRIRFGQFLESLSARRRLVIAKGSLMQNTTFPIS